MRFDGRSVSLNLLRYTIREKFVIKFSMIVMPLLTNLLLSNRLNTAVWRLLGCRVGQKSIIRNGTRINVPFLVVIGANCSIHGHLKSRGRIYIGNGVELVEDVYVSTQSHNVDSPCFESIYAPVNIKDLAWLGPRSIVLPGVTIGNGSVIGAGAVVTKDTDSWGVFCGVPARFIKAREVLNQEDDRCG